MVSLDSGSYVAERFQIIQQESGTKEFYLAADKSNSVGSLQVLVALKVLDKELFDPARVKLEIEALRSLQCENVLRVFETVQGPEFLAVTMERFKGRTLASSMKLQTYSSAEILRILWEISNALEALHTIGLVHGNLSEESIYIDDEGVIKLDPLVANKSRVLDSSADVRALAKIGSNLISAAFYEPQAWLVRKNPKLWNLTTDYPAELTDLIQKLAGYFNIRESRLAIFQIRSSADSQGSFEFSDGGITYVLSSPLFYIFYLTTSILLLSFLSYYNFFHEIGNALAGLTSNL